MFAVLFEVQPKADQWDAYFGHAKALKPELECSDGFVDNVRYRSLTREGTILSLSIWRDEQALVGWRAQANHRAAQLKGRAEVFVDYRLRVGELMRDTTRPELQLDETPAGSGRVLTLVNAALASDAPAGAGARVWSDALGLDHDAAGLVAWDVFDAVLVPGDAMLLITWRDCAAAEDFEHHASMPPGARLRRVRVVRDYGMFDRREAPRRACA